MQVHEIQTMAQSIKKNIQRVIVGKDETIDLITTTVLCSGHILLEDIPGMGKTMLAKALAKSMNTSFSRIQFTPDLLPADLTGLNFFNQQKSAFEFRKGPLMNQVVLADEINRATPRTQSSLLEAMEEQQITVDGVTYALEEPFLVIATQNPIEIGGTFPLPEAQLDRFFMQLSMGYPSHNEEFEILERFRSKNPITDLMPVVDSSLLMAARESYTNVYIHDDVVKYILDITRATRTHEAVELGVSPRGSMALFRGAQAYAAIQGRDYVLPDDVKVLAAPILGHRIKIKAFGFSQETTASKILAEILNKVEVPVESMKAI